MRVAQLIDSLDPGGAERVVINLASAMQSEGVEACVWTSRRGGALEGAMPPRVRYACLARRSTLDPVAMARLSRWVIAQRIDVLHAHERSMLLALIACRWLPHVKLVWHVHFGGRATEKRDGLYRIVARAAHGIVVVSRPLEQWVVSLGANPSRVRVIENFVGAPPAHSPGWTPPALAGNPGQRVIQVANFRSEKGHRVLIDAFEQVLQRFPGAHLSMVGAPVVPAYLQAITEEIGRRGLARSISILGFRNDVADLLAEADVAVQASDTEGMPLTILEYGKARLPVVATAVGQVPAYIEDGVSGRLVPPQDPKALARAIAETLDSHAKAKLMGEALAGRVARVDDRAITRELLNFYRSLGAS